MKILIIEDEIDLLEALALGFKKKGYAVDIADDGSLGLEYLLTNDYDLLILDLNLPSMDGIEVLQSIRKENKELKILILSARTEIDDRVKGLELGANDYLIKPFAFAELEARSAALLRRNFIQRDPLLRHGSLTLDMNLRSVMINENKIELAPKEYAILEYLLFNAGRVVSAEELIEHVWESDADYFSTALKVHMSNLRKKLVEASGAEMILTIRGAGYLIEECKE